MQDTISQATPGDAEELLPLLLSAIGSIAFTLSGSTDERETEQALLSFMRSEGNRLSFSNTLVDRRGDAIAGMLICYPGTEASMLDRPIISTLEERYGKNSAAKLIPECLPGDFYLDSVAVAERFRGQGVAKGLLAAFEERGRACPGCSRLSLIVEPGNEGAAALYRSRGYGDDGQLPVSGTPYTRMIKPI